MKYFFFKSILLFQSEKFSFTNSDAIYTTLAIIIIVFAFAHFLRVDRFKGWAWVTSPASSHQRAWFNTLGEKWYNRLMGAVYAIFGLLILYLTWCF